MSTKVFSTDRFDVFFTRVERAEHLGCGRDVYLAFPRQDDIPRSLCEITVGLGGYVEWLHVCETQRRNRIATEVFIGLFHYLAAQNRELTWDGATEAGEAFCDHMDKFLGDGQPLTA